jgi:hypothetical protein
MEENPKKDEQEAFKKDLEVQRRKLSDDQKRFKEEAERLRSEIASLERQAAERFEFRPPQPPSGRPAQTKGRFIPPTSNVRAAPSVPEEALPEVGSLRTHKSQRYLVIQTWDQLTAGEQAATRLHAKLVAPENV